MLPITGRFGDQEHERAKISASILGTGINITRIIGPIGRMRLAFGCHFASYAHCHVTA
jgi:hypothetical protein